MQYAIKYRDMLTQFTAVYAIPELKIFGNFLSLVGFKIAEKISIRYL